MASLTPSLLFDIPNACKTLVSTNRHHAHKLAKTCNTKKDTSHLNFFILFYRLFVYEKNLHECELYIKRQLHYWEESNRIINELQHGILLK